MIHCLSAANMVKYSYSARINLTGKQGKFGKQDMR